MDLRGWMQETAGSVCMFSDIGCNMSYHPTGLGGPELDEAMTIFTEANVIGGVPRERINWDREGAIAALRTAFPTRWTHQAIAECDLNLVKIGLI